MILLLVGVICQYIICQYKETEQNHYLVIQFNLIRFD